MKVKWHGVTSSERKLIGGGPQGATFGIWEYLVQSNDNANCIDPDYRFKFVDDLTVLEKVNLILIGLASFNCHASVPSDIPSHNQFIPVENLKSQEYLQKIQKWTEEQKMILNQKKTKVMFFNFTDNYQFTARLQLNNENLEVVKQAQLLGVVITDDLKWDDNTAYLVKKAYARMELLRKISAFTNSVEEKKHIYVLYIRSILEQSSVVWHNSLTQDNADDLERVQKCAVRIILGNDFVNYEEALIKADLDTLKSRREVLSRNFAKKCLKNTKTKNMFPVRDKEHNMNIRNTEHFEVKFANTERLKNSAIPSMQRLLNSDYNINKQRKMRKPG